MKHSHHMAVAVATPDVQEAPAAQSVPESPNHAVERTALGLTRFDGTGVTAFGFLHSPSFFILPPRRLFASKFPDDNESNLQRHKNGRSIETDCET